MKRIYALLFAFCAVAVSAVSSFAANADIDALFVAADVSSLKGNVVTMLTAFVVIALIFTGYKYVKRSTKG